MPSDPHLEGQTLILTIQLSFLFKFCTGINGVTLISIFSIPYTLH